MLVLRVMVISQTVLNGFLSTFSTQGVGNLINYFNSVLLIIEMTTILCLPVPEVQVMDLKWVRHVNLGLKPFLPSYHSVLHGYPLLTSRLKISWLSALHFFAFKTSLPRLS